jgi:hypothetical protein
VIVSRPSMGNPLKVFLFSQISMSNRARNITIGSKGNEMTFWLSAECENVVLEKRPPGIYCPDKIKILKDN